MIDKNSKIFVSGHTGLVGSAIVRKLKENGYHNIICRTRKELNLINQKKVYEFLKKSKPNFIFLAAAKVGGIYSNNKYKANYIYENLTIQNNIIHAAHLCNIQDLIFLGSSCVYPRNCKQPIKEEYLMSGQLEKTNDAYAIAKIAGIKMCESYNQQFNRNYKCLMPTNTFGPNDKYDTLNSHFFPAMIKKIHYLKKNNKKEIIIWGNGLPRREIIFVDDIAEACVFFMKKKIKETHINIGTGKDYTIKQYVKMLLKILVPDKKIKIKYDYTKPNGTLRKVLDISVAKKYGWKPKSKFDQAVLLTYKKFLEKAH